MFGVINPFPDRARSKLPASLSMLNGLQTFQVPVRSSFIRLDAKQFTRWNGPR